MRLFRKDIEPRCAYCERGNAINEREVICSRKGIVAPEFHCRGFRYDPLRREPPRPMKLETSKHTAEDFKI